MMPLLMSPEDDPDDYDDYDYADHDDDDGLHHDFKTKITIKEINII